MPVNDLPNCVENDEGNNNATGKMEQLDENDIGMSDISTDKYDHLGDKLFYPTNEAYSNDESTTTVESTNDTSTKAQGICVSIMKKVANSTDHSNIDSKEFWHPTDEQPNYDEHNNDESCHSNTNYTSEKVVVLKSGGSGGNITQTMDDSSGPYKETASNTAKDVVHTNKDLVNDHKSSRNIVTRKNSNPAREQ